jgi:hypothetical protein
MLLIYLVQTHVLFLLGSEKKSSKSSNIFPLLHLTSDLFLKNYRRIISPSKAGVFPQKVLTSRDLALLGKNWLVELASGIKFVSRVLGKGEDCGGAAPCPPDPPPQATRASPSPRSTSFRA